METRIKLFRGDITTLSVDAIVNAANQSLLGGGGVDGAIHSKAGPGLLEECRSIGGCLTGQAVCTSGYNLPAGNIIHTVGPVWRGGHRDEHAMLASAYRQSLLLARENKFRAVAFPSISTGVYRFPREQAALIALTEVKHFLEFNVMPEEVIFVVFDRENQVIYEKLLADEGII